MIHLGVVSLLQKHLRGHVLGAPAEAIRLLLLGDIGLRKTEVSDSDVAFDVN